VDVYVAAVVNPSVVNAPSSVADLLFGSGQVFLFSPGMKSVSLFTGGRIVPTFSNTSFPPAALSGSLSIPVPAPFGDYLFAAAFIRHANGQFVRTDGMPVENSNAFHVN